MPKLSSNILSKTWITDCRSRVTDDNGGDMYDDGDYNGGGSGREWDDGRDDGSREFEGDE